MLKVDDASVPNVHCKLLTFKSATTESQFYEAEIEFFAHKEKLLKEEMKLVTDDEKPVKLVFSARVLGRGKGTPMLKNGVHLLGIEDDVESGEYNQSPNLASFLHFFSFRQMLQTGRASRETSVMKLTNVKQS